MLGVEIDQHHTWKSKTEIFCEEVTSGIFASRNLKPFVDSDTLLSVYNSVVRLILFITLQFGTFLEKHSLNGYKSSRADQLES